MFEGYFIKLYFQLCHLYLSVWNLFFQVFGPLPVVYHISDESIKNITLHYYMRQLDKYRGNFYCKVFHKDNVHHLTFDSTLTDFTFHNILGRTVSKLPKRKNIMLLNKCRVVHYDLNILDNYVTNMRKLEKPPLETKLIFKCLGIDCTDVQFTQLRPFQKVVVPITQVNLLDLYD